MNTFRTVEQVLQHQWDIPEMGKKHELTDQILHSTKLENAIYGDLREGDELLEEVETQAQGKLRSFPALSQDVFQSFYALSPRRNEADTLSAMARKFNANILDHVTAQDDFPTLKDICEGRELLSYEAASEFICRTAGELDDLLADNGGDKGALNTLEKLEDARDAAEQTMSRLLEQYQTDPQPDAAANKLLVAAANQVQSKQRQVEAVSKKIDTTLTRQKQQTAAIIAQGVSAALEKAEETQSIIGAWSDAPGDMSRSPVNLQLLAQVRKSPKLRDISRYLGRFREIFAQGKRNGYTYGRGENYSLELGCDLSRAITSELAMLAAPETIPLFLRKYQQRQIKQYRRREPVYKGMGDIICCLDESGSTQGDAEAWGKAVAMTLLEIAAEQGRKFALIHFSGPGSLHTDLFLPGEYSAEDKLRAAETFLGGGTNFETPLQEALRLMREQQFETADIVFITDGECELSDFFCQHIAQEQISRRFTITGILLDQGSPAMDFSLKAFCQKIYRTSALEGEEILRSLLSTRT